jgi:hypothetical protein
MDVATREDEEVSPPSPQTIEERWVAVWVRTMTHKDATDELIAEFEQLVHDPTTVPTGPWLQNVGEPAAELMTQLATRLSRPMAHASRDTRAKLRRSLIHLLLAVDSD